MKGHLLAFSIAVSDSDQGGQPYVEYHGGGEKLRFSLPLVNQHTKEAADTLWFAN